MEGRKYFTNVVRNLPGKTALVAVMTLLATMSLPVFADAAIYDDFSGLAIDPTRWAIDGGGFTQPHDGYLHYSGTGPVRAKLVSKADYGSGIFTMPFSDYSSNNNAPAAMGMGSVAAIGLGSKDSGAWVRIERGQVLGTGIGEYIEVNWAFLTDDAEWGPIHVNYVPSDITSGFFQVRHDGAQVTFFYRAGETDPWTQMVVTAQGGQPVLDADGRTQPLVVTPGWTIAVPMFIEARPGGSDDEPYNSYTLSFNVDYVAADRLPIDILSGLIAKINSLGPDNFRNSNRQNALINKMYAVMEKIEQGYYADAARKLEKDILRKADGCAVKAEPDRNDWITDCAAQADVYGPVLETISGLQRLL